jgi:hypothetical protein
MVNMPAAADGLEALGLLLRQGEVAGTRRRALLLHAERLPRAAGRQYHLRLARAALTGLAQADRAELFDLPRGRLAVVWRRRGAAADPSGEMTRAMHALKRLLADMPEGQGPTLAELISIYDLPEQSAWLQDMLSESGTETPAQYAEPQLPMDASVLARLELSLAQADLACFARWRPVYRLPGSDSLHGVPPALAWEERYFATAELAASLCPGHVVTSDPWLYLRLTRTIDRRMLALLSGGGELTGVHGLGLHMNVASLLSSAFVRFDERLPGHLRGSVVLSLQASDIMADGAAFAFARNFVRARGYRLMLEGAGAALLDVLDIAAGGFDLVRTSLRQAPAMVPPGVALVVNRIERPGEIEQARLLGAAFISGHALQGRPGAPPLDPAFVRQGFG